MSTSLESFLDLLRAYPFLSLTGLLWAGVLLVAWKLKDFTNVIKKVASYRAATLERLAIKDAITTSGKTLDEEVATAWVSFGLLGLLIVHSE